MKHYPYKREWSLFQEIPFLRCNPFSRGTREIFLICPCSLRAHTDLPAHYLDGGKTVDELSLDALVGQGVVLDMRGRSQIDRRALAEALLGDHIRVLLKTDNGP